LPNITLSGSDIQTAVLANWNQLTKLENLLERKAAEQFFALASIHTTGPFTIRPESVAKYFQFPKQALKSF
jgi:hypothetical protein